MNSEHKPNDNGIPTPCTPLTVRSLARRLGVDRRTIARWIAGGILLPEQRRPVTMFLWGKVVDALRTGFRRLRRLPPDFRGRCRARAPGLRGLPLSPAGAPAGQTKEAQVSRELLQLLGAEATLPQWYTTGGQAVRSVIGKNGVERPPTLREARVEGFLPSVANVLHIVQRPGSQDWAMRDGIAAALASVRRGRESKDDFFARVLEQATHRRVVAQGIGNALRAGVARVARDPSPMAASLLYAPELEGVRAWLTARMTRVDQVDHAFVNEPEGYAGHIALAGVHVEHGLCLVNVHTFLETPGSPQRTWCYELAAARIPFGGEHGGLTLGITVGGSAPVEFPWTSTDLEEGWGCFRAAHRLWRDGKQFDPRRFPDPRGKEAAC